MVVDPHRTEAAGNVELGAFRTYPEVGGRLVAAGDRIAALGAGRSILAAPGRAVLCAPRTSLPRAWTASSVPILIPLWHIPAVPASQQGYKAPDAGPSEYQTIPMEKIEDFGVHANQVRADVEAGVVE